MESEVITNRRVPNSNSKFHTAAHKIFNYTFECIVGSIHLYEAKYLEQAGTILTGNRQLDEEMTREQSRVMITINAMVEFRQQGVAFNVCNPADCAIIYRILHEHLRDWMQQLNANPFLQDVPLEDLTACDDLATEVYPHARPYLHERPVHGKFQRFIEGARSRRQISRAPKVLDADGQDVNRLPQQHESVATHLTNAVAERQKSWR